MPKIGWNEFNFSRPDSVRLAAEWKLALAAQVKANAAVTNRWLATTLHLGNRYEVSRKVSAWQRKPGAEQTIRMNPKPQGLVSFFRPRFLLRFEPAVRARVGGHDN